MTNYSDAKVTGSIDFTRYEGLTNVLNDSAAPNLSLYFTDSVFIHLNVFRPR